MDKHSAMLSEIIFDSEEDLRIFANLLQLNWQRQQAGKQQELESSNAYCDGSSFQLPGKFELEAMLDSLKILRRSGYSIARPCIPTAELAPESAAKQELSRLENLLRESDQAADLVSFWNHREPSVWGMSVDLFINLAQRMASIGEPLLAYDIAVEGLGCFPDSFDLRRLRAFALARSGAVELANSLLHRLHNERPADPETSGMLASTFKDLAAQTSNQTQKDRLFRQAYDLYASNFKRFNDYWNGINAATLAVLCGESLLASSISMEVKQLCKSKLAQTTISNAEAYWMVATLGEAALISKNYSEAEDYYLRAAQLAGRRYADVVSTRRNARLLVKALGVEAYRFDKCFHFPSVAAFVGHMMDRPDRQQPRFPPALEEQLASEIKKRLDKWNVMFGYASAACGSDILFLEALLKQQAEIHVVLPYNASQFLQDSVEIGVAGDWRKRFDAIIGKAAEVITVSGQRLTGGSVLYRYANQMILGLADLLAKRFDTELRTLAVWNGAAGDGPGGTADTVEFWSASGQSVEIIDLASLLNALSPVSLAVRTNSAEPEALPKTWRARPDFPPEICSILFADAVGFSKLEEDEVLLFVTHFLGLVRQVLSSQSSPPLVKNTWGDGLYFVFPSARAAGNLALELRDRIKSTLWSEVGLRELDVRIGLHTGPLYRCIDPVTDQTNYIGSHASRAARIEPITPPGEVYCSQAFAARSSIEQVTEFQCTYVGNTPMAKNFGKLPTYVLRKALGQ